MWSGCGQTSKCVWDAWLQTVPRGPWRTIRWRRGTKGWRRKKVVAVRGWRVTSDGQRHLGSLVGERAPRGQPEEPKSYCSNLPAETTLEELAGLAHRCHAVEQFHEEAKGERGRTSIKVACGRVSIGTRSP